MSILNIDIKRMSGDEPKMRQLTTAAQAAKAIKQELAKAFPKTAFSVTSSNFSMGNSVDIRWTDGPTTDQVDAITGKYQYGHFDGMIDLYEYSNTRNDIPQAKYVMTQRTISDSVYLQACPVLKDHYSIDDPLPLTKDDLGARISRFDHEWMTWYNLVWRVVSKIDLTNAVGIKDDPSFTGGCMWDGFLPLSIFENTMKVLATVDNDRMNEQFS